MPRPGYPPVDRREGVYRYEACLPPRPKTLAHDALDCRVEWIIGKSDTAGAGLFGSLIDAWETPLADVGPEGEDRGRGGNYVVLPPGYDDEIPHGYIPVRSETYNGYALFRAIPTTSSEEDLDKAIALVKTLRVYPLAAAVERPDQKFIDIAGKTFDGIARYDDTFYDRLAEMVNEEPVQTRDLVAMLLGHGARAWRASQPEVSLHLHVITPRGGHPIRLRLR